MTHSSAQTEVSDEVQSRSEPGPYALVATDGIPSVGPLFALRPSDALASLWDRRWPGYFGLVGDRRRGYPVLRPDASDADVQRAREFARERLEAPVEFMRAVQLGATFADLNDREVEQFSEAWAIVPTALDILLVTGTQEDAQWLVQTFLPLPTSRLIDALARDFARTSVHISLRLGDVEHSPAVAAWRALDPNDGSNWSRLSIALAQTGYSPAATALIQWLSDGGSLEDDFDQDGVAAYQLIAQQADDRVLALSLGLIDTFDRFARAAANGTSSDPHVQGINSTAVLASALGYAGAFATDDQRSGLSIGIPSPSRLPAALFDKPEILVDHAFGYLSGAPVVLGDRVVLEMTCRLLRDLQPSRRVALEAHFHDRLAEMAHVHGISPRPNHYAALRVSSGKAHCFADAGAVRLAASPEGHDAKLFPEWMQHGFASLEKVLPDFAADASASIDNLAVLGAYSDEVVESHLDDPARHGLPGVEAYRIYRAVADPSGLGKSGPFVGGDDVRFFLKNLDSTTVAPLWLGARVTLAPRVAGTRLLFGLVLDTAAGDLGGLAGAISRNAEKVETLTSNFGREMIDKVVLRHGEASTQLAFLQTSEAGAHIYEMTSAVTSRENLYVDVYFKGVDTKWRVSFPLFASPFGYSLIQASGGMNLIGLGANGG